MNRIRQLDALKLKVAQVILMPRNVNLAIIDVIIILVIKTISL